MRLAVVIAALVAAVGCSAGSSATLAADSKTQLTITLWPEGKEKGGALKWTLGCAPTSGTLRRAAEACRKLAAATSNPFAPPPRNLTCTEQYGGPQQAVVAGRYEGRRVWIALAARNGCEISRWKRLAYLVPGAPSGSGAPA